MKKNKSIKNLNGMIRESFDALKTKEIVEESKNEVTSFFDQSGERIAHLLINVNEKFESDLKARLIDTFGREFGQEAVLNKLDDFIEYLNRVCRGPTRRYLGVHKFEKDTFKEVYKYDFSSSYGAKQQFYNELLDQKVEGGIFDAHVNFQLSGRIELFSTGPHKNVISITIGDYLDYMSGGTKNVAKQKLKQFLFVLKNVLQKILAHNGKLAQTTFLLKAMILFKKEDVKTSKVLDFEYENSKLEGENVVYTYELFI